MTSDLNSALKHGADEMGVSLVFDRILNTYSPLSTPTMSREPSKDNLEEVLPASEFVDAAMDKCTSLGARFATEFADS